jgi:glyoxylase-like metal-dependent hydrolase (beta-lactamase superfamily II)
VEVHEVEPGLRYWLAPHPEWKPGNDWPEGVLCVEYEAPDARVLIDPLIPRGDEAQFWDMLHDHAKRVRLPVRVLLTAPWHRRDAGLFTGAQLDEDPPAGIETFVADGVQEGQRAFFIRDHRTLVVAEYFMGEADGLRVCPSPAEPDPDRFLRSLHRLLDLPIERVLVAHGPPVLADGASAIRKALETAERGS